MKKLNGHLYFSAFLLLVSGFAIFSALGWSFKTKLFPLATAIPLFILVLLHLYLELFGAKEVSRGAAVDAEFSNNTSDDRARQRALIIFAWIGGFILSVYLIGFPLTVPLFMFCFLTFQSGSGIVQSAVLTGITWAFFYLLFQRLVHIQFESGAIQTWLGL
jgi:hypothetical protein